MLVVKLTCNDYNVQIAQKGWNIVGLGRWKFIKNNCRLLEQVALAIYNYTLFL